MSNALVGSIYQQIIADVIDTSRVDFEEGGVDESVLDVLRQGWQNKLSQLEIATFPWDPKPEPQVVSNPPTVPSNVGNYQPISQQPQPQMAMGSNSGPRIKSEPGLDSPSLSMQQPSQYSGQIPNLPPTATTAQQRAAAHLHQNYGPRAAASISAIQQGFQQGQQGGTTTTIQQMQQIQIMQQQRAQQQQQQQHQQQQQQGMNQGQVQTGQQQLSQQDYQYKQMIAAQTAASQQALGQRTGQTGQTGQNSVSSAQTDGASDTVETTDVIKLFDANSNEVSVSRVEIDGLIRQKIKAIGSTMEGGGLMVPIYQVGSFGRSPTTRRRKGKGRAQLDGGDDDDDDVKEEELDEDAINSDLDDPDEGLNEEDDDDEGLGHIMLCMYDKVQRVKNKWKCVMKDGVLTVNKKEYVFHKATGEYEW